jgi:hypothetical protein
MLEFVQLTEEEKLLVTEGIELHQELIEKLADIPTPAGPTPRELETSLRREKKLIPLKLIQHPEKQSQVAQTNGQESITVEIARSEMPSEGERSGQ